MKTIILAAGQASRLGKLTRNIQKCLISFGGKPAINHLLEKLPNSDEVCVCLSDDFRGELLRNYLTSTYRNINFRFIVQEQPIGTANAVSLCLSTDDDVIISWSDVIPKKNIERPQSSAIYTTDDFACRYRFDGSKIEATDGNVIGIFFLTKQDAGKIKPLLEKHPISDFVDILQLSGLSFCNVPIECFDFGTQKTLTQTSNSFNASAYADIEKDGAVIYKQYKPFANDLFEKESLWYRFSPTSVRRFIPKTYAFDEVERKITMEYIDALSVDFNSEEEMKDFLATTVYILDEYFHSNKYPPHRESLYNEYISAPIERCALVCKTVPRFNDKKLFVNGQVYENPYRLLKSKTISDELIDRLLPESFCFIHGDPTLQNLMQGNGKVWFIDPKAKFGNIWLYGDPKYDFAKLYYSFVGNYDKFNLGSYNLLVTDSGFDYEIDRAKFANLDGWYLNYLSDKLSINPTDIKLIHSLVWLRVVGYVLPQSIEQSIVAFLNGTVLFNEAMNER